MGAGEDSVRYSADRTIGWRWEEVERGERGERGGKEYIVYWEREKHCFVTNITGVKELL